MAIERCTLVNKLRAIQVLNLPAHIVPEMSSRMVVATQAHDPKTGARALQAKRINAAGSITFMPAGTEGSQIELPRTALRAPEVQTALKAKSIALVGEPSAPKDEKSAPAAKTQGSPPALPAGKPKTETRGSASKE